MKRFSLFVAVLVFAGCAGLKVGIDAEKRGVVVEAEGATTLEAERQAVSGLLELFISPSVREASSHLIDERVLAHPRVYVKRKKILAISTRKVRIRALILTRNLLKDLNGLALIKPGGMSDVPKVLISLKETGQGAGSDVGRASDVLRRRLLERGYEALDLSDKLHKRHQETGSEAEALAAAKASGGDVMVSGVASAFPAPEDSSAGYRIFQGRLLAGVHVVATGESVISLEEVADSTDLSSQAAAAKALEDVGEAAAEKLCHALSRRFERNSEATLEVAGLMDLDAVRRFVVAARRLPPVTGVTVLELEPGLARLEIFTEKLSTEDVAALLLRLPDHVVEMRSVDTDSRVIEMQCGGRK